MPLARFNFSFLKIPVALTLLWALSSCSVVGSKSTATYSVAAQGSVSSFGVRCKSKLGSYSLPRSEVTITITTSDRINFAMTSPVASVVPDREHTYCLDHLSNIFADDAVWVRKEVAQDPGAAESSRVGKHSPYLQLVASNAVDQSVTVIRKLIRAVFLLISNDGSFSDGRSLGINAAPTPTTVARHSFDPFDQYELAEVNQAIKRYGFCLVLDGYSHSDWVSAGTYCNAPQQTVQHKPSKKSKMVMNQRYVTKKPVSGIFYRPKTSYRMLTFTNQDPGGRTKWHLSHMTKLSMENISPVISVGVDRALFTKQKVALIFEDGLLLNACLARGSAALQAVQIPLDIVYGVIALPAARINAALNASRTRQQLIAAEQQYIIAQREYIDYLVSRGNRSPSEDTELAKNIGNKGLNSTKGPKFGTGPHSQGTNDGVGGSPKVDLKIDTELEDLKAEKEVDLEKDFQKICALPNRLTTLPDDNFNVAVKQ